MRRIALFLAAILLLGCSAGHSQTPAKPPVNPVTTQDEPYTPTPPERPEPSVRLAFVGDILLGASLAGLLESKGAGWVWEHVAPQLREADLAIGNLETALSTGGTPEPNKQFTFRSHPSTLDGAVWAGIDLFSLANNHSRDYGPEALLETIRHLTAAKIDPVGAGADLEAAIRPVIKEVGGLRLAFLAFSRVIPETHWVAWKGNPGVAPGWEPKVVRQAVEAARAEADHVIVLIHWGEERQDQPRPTDVELAHLLQESGATLVIGHHPHVLQGIDGRHSKLIAYSLGNFIFTSPSPRTDESAILEVTLDRTGVTAVKATPLIIENGQPRPAKPAESRRILERLDSLSRPWSTRLTGDGQLSLPSGRPQSSGVQ